MFSLGWRGSGDVCGLNFKFGNFENLRVWVKKFGLKFEIYFLYFEA